METDIAKKGTVVTDSNTNTRIQHHLTCIHSHKHRNTTKRWEWFHPRNHCRYIPRTPRQSSNRRKESNPLTLPTMRNSKRRTYRTTRATTRAITVARSAGRFRLVKRSRMNRQCRKRPSSVRRWLQRTRETTTTTKRATTAAPPATPVRVTTVPSHSTSRSCR